MKITSDFGRRLGQQPKDFVDEGKQAGKASRFDETLEATRSPKVRGEKIDSSTANPGSKGPHRQVQSASEYLLARQRVTPNRFTTDIYRSGNTALAQERLLSKDIGTAHTPIALRDRRVKK